MVAIDNTTTSPSTSGVLNPVQNFEIQLKGLKKPAQIREVHSRIKDMIRVKKESKESLDRTLGRLKYCKNLTKKQAHDQGDMSSLSSASEDEGDAAPPNPIQDATDDYSDSDEDGTTTTTTTESESETDSGTSSGSDDGSSDDGRD